MAATAHALHILVNYNRYVAERLRLINSVCAYASQHISERAAIPKEIKILAKMPVTAVGKIFKPALSMMEIENVVRQEAKHLDVKLTAVEVIQHRKLGLLAKVSAKDNVDILVTALGRYTFKSEVF